MKILKTQEPEIIETMIRYGWGYMIERRENEKIYCFALIDEGDISSFIAQFPTDKYYIDEQLCF